MTYLELVKKLGLTKLVICLMDELGYQNKEITEKLKITEPTIYNARKDYERISEALKIVNNLVELPEEDTLHLSKTTYPSIVEQTKTDLRNVDVQKIIDSFQSSFGTTSSSRYDRFAASRLAKKYGADEIVKIIEVLAQHAGDKYTPTVSNVRQIEQKWVNIAAFFKRNQDVQPIDL